MPKGVPSKTSNRRKSQRARREWERWEREHYIIYNKDGDEAFTPAEDEIFVSLFHYKEDKNLEKYPNAIPVKGTINPKYKVSNKGNIIALTFHNIDRPYLMKQTEKLNDRDEPYMIVGNGWSVHSLVWFSFAADAIRNGYEFPKSYGIPIDEIRTLKRLAKLTGENINKRNVEGEYWIEIHHRDLNTRNNCLENLECDNHEIHALLHKLNNLETEDDQLKAIIKHPFEVPTRIDLGRMLSVSKINPDKYISNLPDTDIAKIHEIYWTNYSQQVIKEVTSIVGRDFVKRDWYMGLKGQILGHEQIAFFTVSKQNDGGMSVKWLDQKGHNQLVNKELDIFCDNGRIYMMNYTNDEDEC